MKKADLIYCTDGNHVLKNMEGSMSRYWPDSREKVLKCKCRPATEDEIKQALQKLDITIGEKTPKKIIDKLKYQLCFHSDNIAYSSEQYKAKFPEYWYYELKQ